MKYTTPLVQWCLTLTFLVAVFLAFAIAQEVSPEDEEATLRAALLSGHSSGTKEERFARREAAIELLKKKGTEPPYKQMLVKWIREYEQISFGEELLSIVAGFNDTDLFAVVVEKLDDLERGWPKTEFKFNSISRDFFAKVKCEGAVPIIERFLARPFPPTVAHSTEKLGREDAWLLYDTAYATKVLVVQKGKDAYEKVKEMRDKTFAWFHETQKTVRGGTEEGLDFDIHLHRLTKGYDRLLARFAWSEERANFLKMLQEDDPYQRHRALTALCVSRDTTALKYVVPLLDDTREVWIPFSEPNMEYFRRRGLERSFAGLRQQDSETGDVFLTREVSRIARNVMRLLSGMNPVVDHTGNLLFVPENTPLGDMDYPDDAAAREAWREWWKENMYRPEFNE